VDYLSRTKKKKEALALQETGERLVRLSAEQLKEMDLPPDLYQAVTFAKTLKSRGALKRQMQFIGTIMRTIDPGPVMEALRNLEAGDYNKAAEFRETERWRDELIGGNRELLEEIVDGYPGADRQQLSQLVRQAVKEKEQNRPPKASRALFRYLRQVRSEKG
jgi:ribosome-associated protein